MRCVRWLPLGFAARLGEWIGTAAYLCLPSLRERGLRQLRIAYADEKSEGELRTILRGHLALLGRGLLSYIVLHRMGQEATWSRVEVVGAEHLERALEGGRGAVVVGAHFGLMELGGCWVGAHHDGASVGRPGRPGRPTHDLIKIRADMGTRTIQRGDPRQLIRVLKDKRPLCLAADHQVKDVNGVFVPFFGTLAHTPVGPANLSIRFKAPLITIRTEWVDRTHHRITLEPPMQARDDLPRDERAAELTARFTANLEAHIRARPEHWFWLHRRWDRDPQAEPDVPRWPPAPVDPPAAEA